MSHKLDNCNTNDNNNSDKDRNPDQNNLNNISDPLHPIFHYTRVMLNPPQKIPTLFPNPPTLNASIYCCPFHPLSLSSYSSILRQACLCVSLYLPWFFRFLLPTRSSPTLPLTLVALPPDIPLSPWNSLARGLSLTPFLSTTPCHHQPLTLAAPLPHLQSPSPYITVRVPLLSPFLPLSCVEIWKEIQKF
jgi:hypothetical protein